MDIKFDNLVDLANTYGEAFYLLDSKQFDENYDNLTKAFSDEYPYFNIAYSYKTNYIPKLCKIVDKKGGYAEVVSDMEMEVAIRCGVHPSKIIWNGPIKKLNKVKELLLAGGTVNIDSYDELKQIEKIAEEFPKHCLNVGIRCNFDVGDGVISRFGFDTDAEQFNQSIEIIKNIRNLHLVNLQCHFAKRNIEYWPARVDGMLDVVDKVYRMIGYVPDRVDFGGGLFGNMHPDLKEQFSYSIPSYVDYAKVVANKFALHFPDTKIELLIEPGSALVGDCMKFVGRVKSIKRVQDKYFATVLGSQKNISMVSVNPPMEIIKSENTHVYYKDIDIVGYTCIEGDVLFKKYRGELAVDDFVVFSNCGSYSVVMKPPFILPNFPILDISGNNVQIIKKQETFDDLFHTFLF